MVIVGSIGYDDIETPVASGSDILGGSAVHSGVSSSFHLPLVPGGSPRVGIVGPVGNDFSDSHKSLLEGLGIDKHPELLDVYFRNYTRVLYLAQREDGKLLDKAKWAADELGLPLEYLITGHGSLESRLLDIM